VPIENADNVEIMSVDDQSASGLGGKVGGLVCRFVCITLDDVRMMVWRVLLEN
jgi:hypothetical protein